MPIKFFTSIFNHDAHSTSDAEEIRNRTDGQRAAHTSDRPPLPAQAAGTQQTSVVASTLSRLMARNNASRARNNAPQARTTADAPPRLPKLNFDSMPVLSMDSQEDEGHPPSVSAQGSVSAPSVTHGIEDIQFVPPPDTKGVSAALTARQAGQGPVFNHDGTLNHVNLESFVAGLIAQFPPLPSNAHPLLARRREQLIHQLTQIPIPATEGMSPNADQMLEIRDKFAAAANDARKLVQHFLGHRFPRHPDNQAALYYSCLAANLVELKRLHLTGAAPAAMNKYVQRERANLEKRIPTLSYMTSSNLSRDAALSASHHAGAASVEFGGTRNKIIWFDDDRDVNFWSSYGGAVKGGGPSAWIFNASVKWGLEAGGTYFETEKLTEMLQLMVNRDANRTFPARSAGPFARVRSLQLKSGYNAFLKSAAAHAYTEAPGAPLYLNDKKLAKGFNATKLHVLGAALDHVAGTSAFGALVKSAYPAAAARLKGESGSGVFQEPLASTVSTSDPVGHGRLPYRNYKHLLVDASIGKKMELTAGLGIGGEWSVGISGNTAQFHLQNPEAAHSLLDPSYHADMANTLKLTAQLDALLGPSQPPKLHLYRRVRSTLGQASTEPLPDIDQRYYGATETIPSQFRDSMTNSDVAQLSNRMTAIGLECNHLRANYLDFVDNAAKLAAKPDKYTPSNTLETLHATRVEAFNAVNRAVWGATGYPGGAAAALKDPDKFIAQTHDALGLALGCAGIHLAVVKRRITQLLPASANNQIKDQARTDIQEADRIYLRVKTLLSKSYLPMKKIDVYLKEGTFEDLGLSQRHNLAIKTSANMLFRFNIGEMLAQRFGKTMGDYDVTNEAGQIALSAQCRYQYADKQINPSRQGQFLEFKFTAQGGYPITGPLIVKGVMHALQKLHPEVDIAAQRTSITEQLQGLALDGVSGAGVVLRLRRFPDAAHQRFTFQFLRVFESKTAGPKIGIPIPTPVGLFKVKWSKQVSLQNAVYEVLGPDIGYLMLQHKKLKEMLSITTTNARRLADQGVDENRVMRAQFKDAVDSDPVLAAGFEGDKNAKWVADSYFGSSTLIPTVIDEYMAYAAAAGEAQANGTSLVNAPAANEFYRFFERNTEAEPFHRVAEYAMEAKHHAPGSTVNWTDKDNELQGAPHDPFALPPSLLEKIPMPVLPSGRRWEDEKAHIQGLSFDERINYFCSPEGRPVLDIFVKIIDAIKSVHDISRHRVRDTSYGFWTRLKDSGERKRANAALGNQTRPVQLTRSNRLWDQLTKRG